MTGFILYNPTYGLTVRQTKGRFVLEGIVWQEKAHWFPKRLTARKAIPKLKDIPLPGGDTKQIQQDMRAAKNWTVMSWASHYIEKLKEGETVQFRPRGNSMEPKISSGDLCTVEPVTEHPLKKGDIVLCTVKGSDYLHLVQSVQKKMGGYLYQIGNNKKRTNGTIFQDRVYGKLVKVET